MTKGVDISVHNGNVDFNALKAAGIQFVIIRCGYGRTVKFSDTTKGQSN
jgi:GH25 family lysozyme M1 (1,4-beta-N-acetylmuramidase)